jgi:hypothetical protein
MSVQPGSGEPPEGLYQAEMHHSRAQGGQLAQEQGATPGLPCRVLVRRGAKPLNRFPAGSSGTPDARLKQRTSSRTRRGSKGHMCSAPPNPETIESGAPRFEARPLVPDPASDEGATLLVAALEEIESRRATLEWLLDNDLLRQCLV